MATHLVVLVLDGATSSKNRLRCFKSDQDEVWYDCSSRKHSSIDVKISRWRPRHPFMQQSAMVPLGSARTAVGLFLLLVLRSGTHCPKTCGIQSVLWTVTDSHWRHFYFCSTGVFSFSALEVCYENALYKFTFDIDIDIENEATSQCLCSSVRQFLIYSTFVLFTYLPYGLVFCVCVLRDDDDGADCDINPVWHLNGAYRRRLLLHLCQTLLLQGSWG